MTWTSCGKLIIFFSCSYFCLNQSACHPERTIHKTKPSFHLEYRYIFCRLSRRSRQITVWALEIIYSFWLLWFWSWFNRVFIRVLFRFFLIFELTALSVVFFFFWVHTTAFFWIYWHASHSSLQSQLLQEHTPYISECSFKEQWQSQLQFLHLFIILPIII